MRKGECAKVVGLGYTVHDKTRCEAAHGNCRPNILVLQVLSLLREDEECDYTGLLSRS